jgi:LPXTG-motif cell wall-anchored protein
MNPTRRLVVAFAALTMCLTPVALLAAVPPARATCGPKGDQPCTTTTTKPTTTTTRPVTTTSKPCPPATTSTAPATSHPPYPCTSTSTTTTTPKATTTIFKPTTAVAKVTTTIFATVAPATELPATGSSPGLAFAGAGLVLVGAIAMITRRRG